MNGDLITRATVRADGLTVGESMDRDAAFLRSVGIDAKDGAQTIDEQREAFKEAMRVAVLAALDETAKNRFGVGSRGWTDRDLVGIFPAIDRHSATLFDRLLK